MKGGEKEWKKEKRKKRNEEEEHVSGWTFISWNGLLHRRVSIRLFVFSASRSRSKREG